MTAPRYDDPLPVLTDLEVREMQEAWDMQERHIMPPAVSEEWLRRWGFPCAVLGLILLWTLIGGLLVNWATGK